MNKLQEIYQRIQENKKRQKEIRQMLKDELTHHARYQELTEQMKQMREEKKGIEMDVRAHSTDAGELDDLKVELQTDQELLADVALNMYMKDETVEIVDDHDQTWHPVFKVQFKKTH